MNKVIAVVVAIVVVVGGYVWYNKEKHEGAEVAPATTTESTAPATTEAPAAPATGSSSTTTQP